MTHIWRIPDDYPNNWLGEYDASVSPDRFLFRKTERFPKTDQIPTVRYSVASNKIEGFDVLPNNTMVPLVSEEVITQIRLFCADDFEPINAAVFAKNDPLNGYSFLNILAKVEAIDLAASDCLMIPGTQQVMKVRRMRLTSSGVGRHHLARDPRVASYIFCSEALKEVFERSGWKHCSFMNTDDVRP